MIKKRLYKRILPLYFIIGFILLLGGMVLLNNDMSKEFLQVGIKPNSDTAKTLLTALNKHVFQLGVIAIILGFIFIYTTINRITRLLTLVTRSIKRFSKQITHEPIMLSETAELADLSITLKDLASKHRHKIAEVETEKAEKEALLASLIDGVIGISKDGKIHWANETAEKICAVKRGGLIGKQLHEVFRNTELTSFMSKVFQADVISEMILSLTVNNVPKMFQVSGRKVMSDDPEKVMGIAIFHDITELTKLERIRKDFVANVSHELRTPLTLIKGFVETLQGGTSKEDQEKFLDIIKKHVSRLDLIIEDLLSLSKLDQDKDSIDKIRSPLTPIIESVVKNCSALSNEKMVTIRLISDDIDVPVNETLIEQAFQNICDNAVKYSPENSIIEIKVTQDETFAYISFKDQGPGIEEEQKEKIFERFFRVDKARSRDMGGTGLGLAISRHIVRVHGGRILVESKPGKGAVFTVKLPKENK